MVQSRLKLGFLASHGGTNLQAIIDACNSGLAAEPRVVISNNSNAGALERARRHGVPAYHLSGQTHSASTLDRVILETLSRHQVEIVCLAGYMKRLGPAVLAAFSGRILNIHPSLLPKYGGKGFYGAAVHRAVLAAGDTHSGATVHLVDEEYDQGPTLAQAKVLVLPDDTPQTLAARVLAEEHRLYPQTLAQIAAGAIILPGLNP